MYNAYSSPYKCYHGLGQEAKLLGRSGVLGLPWVGTVMAKMRSNEDRERCETQLTEVTNIIEEYFRITTCHHVEVEGSENK